MCNYGRRRVSEEGRAAVGRGVMWRVVVRQLMCCHQRPSDLCKTAKLGFQGPPGVGLDHTCRHKSSVAAAAIPLAEGSKGDLAGVDVGWELRPASALAFAGAPSTLPCRVLNPLEGSVSALDEALHSAVHVPWLANPMWWVQWSSDSKAEGLDHFSGLKSGTQSTFRSSLRAKSFGSSAAAVEEVVAEEEAGKDDDEDLGQEERKKQKTEKTETEKMQSSSYLRERQIAIESLAWQEAAEEYRELLLEMCKKNLAPNLPYVQSLVLGWFEPFKKAIEAEQSAVSNLEFKEHRAGYGPYLALLPADMLAVITMHKLMGLLMTDLNQGGCVKVVVAASMIGEAVESEVTFFPPNHTTPHPLRFLARLFVSSGFCETLGVWVRCIDDLRPHVATSRGKVLLWFI